MNRLGIGLLLCLMPLVGGCGLAGHSEAETAAVASARQWLALVDEGAYVKSWEEAAPFFKNAVPCEQWDRTMRTGRAPFGRNLSRTLITTRYCNALPGAPDGEYVVIQFKASFENKKLAVETVTPMRITNGTWRVSGYYMK